MESRARMIKKINKKSVAGALLLVFLLSIFFVGCTVADEQRLDGDNVAEGDVYYTFTDDLGNEVVLAEKPERVAVLFSSFAEVWQCAGGMVDITVGESVERGFADASAVLVDDGAGKTINTEVLVAAKPDFVICSADVEAQVKTAEFLRDVGVPVACFRVEVFSEYMNMLEICTDITEDKEGYAENGTTVAENVETMLNAVKEKDALCDEILFVRAGSGASATKAKRAEDHFAAAMLAQLGTKNIADDVPVLLDGLSIEEILRSDPDAIFISTMGDADAAKAHMNSVLSQPAWQALTAVQNGNVYYLPKELFQFKPNARWDDAYEYLIDIVYGK